MKEKLLITGGSGFLGKNLIHAIQKGGGFGLDIYNLSRTPVLMEGVTDIAYDASGDRPLPLGGIGPFDYIVNLLALSNDRFCDDFTNAQRINIDFTKNILEFARTQEHLKKFIHLSSIIIYDTSNVAPVDENGKLYLNYTNYSFTKGIADHYATYYSDKFHLPVINFRLANIYGPYQNFIDSPFLIPSKIMQGIAQKKITVLNLSPRRDWIYSTDAADAIVKGLFSEVVGTLNLGSGIGTSVKEIIEEMSMQLGVGYASIDQLIKGPMDFYCDISKIRKTLDWSPVVDLKQGLANTIEYIKTNSAAK